MDGPNELNDRLPPSYEEPLGSLSETLDLEDIPGYFDFQRSSLIPTARSIHKLKDFEYKVENNGKTLVSLTLTAHESISKTIPTFVSGSPVTGRINLDLCEENPEHIKSVLIKIQGQLVTGGSQFLGYTYTFLDATHEIWAFSADRGALARDTYHWPISINLPDNVTMECGVDKRLEIFSLPQSFNDRFIHATIRYELSLKISRSGFLRSSDVLSAPFGFIPLTRPGLLPPLRRLAYEEGTPLLPPKVDQDGWFFHTAVMVEGKTPNNNTSKIECRLYLAKPLSYTRGSVIPLFMTMESDDKQSLDLLSSPKVIHVRVRRRIKYHAEPHKRIESKVWRDEVDHSQRAVWWPANESGSAPSDRLREVNGELHLKPNMAPTTAIGNFRIDYSVVFLKFKSAGFVHTDENLVLAEQPITITTAYAPGPRPIFSTPANYEPDEKLDSNDLQTEGEYSKGFY